MKPIPKHLRPRYRYIVVSLESWSNSIIDKTSFQQSIWASVNRLFGDLGSAKSDLYLIRFEFHNGTGYGIIRTRRDSLHLARSGIACTSSVNGHPIGILVLGISGTIKSCEQKYLPVLKKSLVTGEVTFEGNSYSSTSYGELLDIKIDNDFIGATNMDIT